MAARSPQEEEVALDLTDLASFAAKSFHNRVPPRQIANTLGECLTAGGVSKEHALRVCNAALQAMAFNAIQLNTQDEADAFWMAFTHILFSENDPSLKE